MPEAKKKRPYNRQDALEVALYLRSAQRMARCLFGIDSQESKDTRGKIRKIWLDYKAQQIGLEDAFLGGTLREFEVAYWRRKLPIEPVH